MIRKVSAYDLSQPLALSWDGFMHSTLQFFLESPQPGPHPIAARLPLELKDAASGSTADVSKPKEVKCLRLAKTSTHSSFSRVAAKLN